MTEGPEGPERIPTPEERQQNREKAKAGSSAGGASGKNWWSRRSKKAKIALIIGAIIVIAIIASAVSGGSKKKSGSNQSSDNAGGAPSSNNGPVVRGTWNAECNQFSAGDKDACAAVRVSTVTCQWQDDHVHMAVNFKNTFGAHVTVHMNPIYKLANAGIHGNGLTNVEDVGLDPGEVRKFETDLDPAGVSGNPRITLCRPGVDVLQGVALG